MGYSGINVTGGSDIFFLGLKFSTAVFFWVEDLTVYFLRVRKICAYFFGFEFPPGQWFLRNSSQSSRKIRKHDSNNLHVAGSKISSLVFFWVHNIRSMHFFGCKILGSVGPPRHVYTRVPPLGRGFSAFAVWCKRNSKSLL